MLAMRKMRHELILPALVLVSHALSSNHDGAVEFSDSDAHHFEKLRIVSLFAIYVKVRKADLTLIRDGKR